MEKVKTEWFVEALDAFTNNVVSKQMAAIGFEFEGGHHRISDDTSHFLIPVPDYGFVSALYKSKKDKELSFRVFKRQGKYGKISEWKFGETKKQNKKPLKK